ncbi:hypothetical protein F2Q70_00011314 [Brassica cretica]|uniref:Uncharacterized protein n=1 Tax=Brassica cretica TaxID=69181 RepID=A0A8S9M7M7_BRACR|nr:hypothetical protein F2Q70_00011314 [Brassica cretica]
MNPELLLFPSSLVGGRPSPRRPFTDPFSSPAPSWGDVPKTDSEVVPMGPLRRLCSCFFDDGPRSEIREGDLANMRRKYVIHPSVGMRSPTEFERAPDWGRVKRLSMRHTWKQAYGALSLLSFYHLRSRDGAPLVEEPSRGVRGNHPFGDGWNSRYVFMKIRVPVGYPTSWHTVDVSRPVSFEGEEVGKLIMGVPRRFRWVTFLMSREALRHSRVWGNVARLPVSLVYDEYQKVKARKRRLSYTPPPKLARAALSANDLSSISSTSGDIFPNRDLLVDAHRRLTGEVFLLRSQVQDMMARRDLLVKQVKASARWELMKEWLERRVDHWNPEEEYRRHLFLYGGLNHQSGSFSQAVTPRSVVGLRFSEGPSF